MAGQSRQLTNWLLWYQVSRLPAVLAFLMYFQWKLNHSLIISVGLTCIHNKTCAASNVILWHIAPRHHSCQPPSNIHAYSLTEIRASKKFMVIFQVQNSFLVSSIKFQKRISNFLLETDFVKMWKPRTFNYDIH